MNYTQFSKDSENVNDNIVSLTVNQNKVFNEKIETEDIVTEPTVIEEGDAKLMGVVSGCAKLNVRKEPNVNADVLCVIKKGDEVEFNMEEESTYDDFYAIITTGKIKVKGYCMKEYISIK